MPDFIRGQGRALTRRRTVSLTLSALAFLGLSSPHRATAQDLQPGRQILLIVPFAAGGPTDIVARGAAQRLGDRLKTSVVVENKPGSAGAIGAQALARAEPDGHTIGIISAPLAQNQAIYKKPLVDGAKDFTFVTIFADQARILLTRKDFPASSLIEFNAAP